MKANRNCARALVLTFAIFVCSSAGAETTSDPNSSADAPKNAQGSGDSSQTTSSNSSGAATGSQQDGTPRATADSPSSSRRTNPPAVVNPLSASSFNCPFRPTEARTNEIWNAARVTLTSLRTSNQACRNALEPLQTTIRTQISPGLSSDPNAPDRVRLRDLDNRVIELSANSETDPLVLQSAQEEANRLRMDLDARSVARNNAIEDQSAQATSDQLRAILQSIPSIRSACQGTDENVGVAAVRSGLNLFSAAAPMMFGPMSSVGAIADVVSSLAVAMTGPSQTDRGLQFMSTVEDLDNLSCFYFHVQKAYCDNRNPTSDDTSADMARIVQVRRLFEDSRYGALGNRMRSLFNQVYGDDPHRSLGPVLDPKVAQYCGLMSSIPGRSGRCTQADQQRLGQPFDSCAYMQYYDDGTTPRSPGGPRRHFPSAPPAGPMSTSASAASR